MIKHTFSVLIYTVLLVTASCRPPLEAVTVQPQLYNINQEQALTQVQGEDKKAAEAVALIAPYRAKLEETMNRELATVVTPLKKARPEGNLGNWMVDLLHTAGKDVFPGETIAFSTANHGGLRVQEIGTGPLLVSELYELMPFDNQWVALELSGTEVVEFINHIANSGGWPVSKELNVSRGTDGQLNVLISSEKVVPNKKYMVAMPDYVANGGGNSTMLKDKPQLASNWLMRDLLIEYAGKITSPIDVKATGKRMNIR
ncbi:MAG: 5'-nucleotidase [Bacteroidota bacterium]